MTTPPVGSCRLETGVEAMEALEVVGQAHQVPFERHLGQATQEEAAEAEHRFHDSENRLDRLLAQAVERTPLDGGRAVGEVLGKARFGRGRGRILAFLQLLDGASVALAFHRGQDARGFRFVLRAGLLGGAASPLR